MLLQVFEQIKAQEATKQQELKAKEAEFKAQAEQAAIVSRAAAKARLPAGAQPWGWCAAATLRCLVCKHWQQFAPDIG